MESKEIIKALECCFRGTTDDCGGCPCFNNNTYTTLDCMEELMKNALALIKHQQAERETMLKDLQFRTNQVIEQQADVERLQKELALKGLEYHLLERERAKDISGFVDDLKLVRAEAIKEFAERLTDKASIYRVNGFDYAWQITQEDIDNLVKEMVGDE